MARLSVLLLPILIACVPSTQQPVCMEKYAWTDLSSLNLTGHKAFDRFDSVLRKGQPIWDGYDALLKVDPQSVLVHVRAAWALEFMGPTNKGPVQAGILLQGLKKNHPDNTDVRFLDLAMGIKRIQRRGATGSDIKIKALLQRARAFSAQHPKYTGPHGVLPETLVSAAEQLARNTGARQ